MLALNLHSKQINLKGFFYFKLFHCPPDVKKGQTFSETLLHELLAGLHYKSVVGLRAPRDRNLHFTILKTQSLFKKWTLVTLLG